MTGNKKVVSLLLGMLTVAGATVSARVEWIEKDHDFGLMKEVAGPKTGYSRFVNLGPEPVSIFNVRPSCGCTSADWSDAEIAPGDTATVSYTYDPHMRPGKFDKSVKVQLSDGTRHTIRITGNVYGTPESLSTLYPLEAGELRLSEVALNMGEVKHGRRPIGFVNAYCLATDSVTPGMQTDVRGLSVSPSVDKAGPGDLITYTVSLDTQALGEYGPVEGMIRFTTPGGSGELPWRAYVVPDPEALLRMAGGKIPVCEVIPEPIDLGVIDRGAGATAVTTEIMISNAGKGELEIYRIVSGSEAIEVLNAPRAVKAGKSSKVKLRVNPSRLNEGPARIPLTIISSDPRNPQTEIHAAVYGGASK